MKYRILLFTFLITTLTWGQDNYTSNISQSWENYKTAFIENDFIKVSSLTNPMVLEKTGGETYFVDDLLYEKGMYETQGIVLIDLKSKQPSAVLKTEFEWQAMMPYEKILKIQDQKIVENHFMLITSKDEGQTWRFFDLSKQDVESIKVYLPHYDERLNVYLQ